MTTTRARLGAFALCIFLLLALAGAPSATAASSETSAQRVTRLIKKIVTAKSPKATYKKLSTKDKALVLKEVKGKKGRWI